MAIGLIIIGAIMVGLQVLSFIGNLGMGTLDFFTNVTNISVFFYDLVRFCSYNLIGIIGLVLVGIGVFIIIKRRKNIK